jgi:hypothetical protein
MKYEAAGAASQSTAPHMLPIDHRHTFGSCRKANRRAVKGAKLGRRRLVLKSVAAPIPCAAWVWTGARWQRG